MVETLDPGTQDGGARDRRQSRCSKHGQSLLETRLAQRIAAELAAIIMSNGRYGAGLVPAGIMDPDHLEITRLVHCRQTQGFKRRPLIRRFAYGEPEDATGHGIKSDHHPSPDLRHPCPIFRRHQPELLSRHIQCANMNLPAIDLDPLAGHGDRDATVIMTMPALGFIEPQPDAVHIERIETWRFSRRTCMARPRATAP